MEEPLMQRLAPVFVLVTSVGLAVKVSALRRSLLDYILFVRQVPLLDYIRTQSHHWVCVAE